MKDQQHADGTLSLTVFHKIDAKMTLILRIITPSSHINSIHSGGHDTKRRSSTLLDTVRGTGRNRVRLE